MSLVLAFVIGVIILGAAIVVVVSLLSPEGRQHRLGDRGVRGRRLFERRSRTFRRKATPASRRLTLTTPPRQAPTTTQSKVIRLRPTTPTKNGFSMRNRRREVNLEALCRRTGKRRRVCGCEKCIEERAKLGT